MNRKIVVTAAILGLIAIILGAFGAHALKEKLEVAQLATFETGVRYQMYHALFLLFIGIASGISEKRRIHIFYLTIIGTLFFSGSIYLLATQSISGVNFKSIGVITPIGGLFLLAAWTLLIVDLVRIKVINSA